MTNTLNISEIFYSIQGEGTRSGLPCVFVRLQGCMLRCSWCDTPYALEINQVEKIKTFDEIIEEINSYDCQLVEFTGGEPLTQKNVADLMKILLDMGKEVAVETNGHADISILDARVVKIMDIKCPDSAMSKYNRFSNIDFLDAKDEIKFVISSEADANWAFGIINEYQLFEKVKTIMFSPAFGLMEAKRLAEIILQADSRIRLQLQIHKFIWSPDTRGV